MGLITLMAQKDAMMSLLCEASWALEELAAVLLLHVRRDVAHTVKGVACYNLCFM